MKNEEMFQPKIQPLGDMKSQLAKIDSMIPNSLKDLLKNSSEKVL